MSTTTTHAYTVPDSLVPGHLHPNTQRKYREVLRKFHVTQETTLKHSLNHGLKHGLKP